MRSLGRCRYSGSRWRRWHCPAVTSSVTHDRSVAISRRRGTGRRPRVCEAHRGSSLAALTRSARWGSTPRRSPIGRSTSTGHVGGRPTSPGRECMCTPPMDDAGPQGNQGARPLSPGMWAHGRTGHVPVEGEPWFGFEVVAARGSAGGDCSPVARHTMGHCGVAGTPMRAGSHAGTRTSTRARCTSPRGSARSASACPAVWTTDRACASKQDRLGLHRDHPEATFSGARPGAGTETAVGRQVSVRASMRPPLNARPRGEVASFWSA